MMQLSPQIEVEKADVEGVQLHVEPGGEIHGKLRLDTGEKFDWTQLNVQLMPVAENEIDGSAAAAIGMAVRSREVRLDRGCGRNI